MLRLPDAGDVEPVTGVGSDVFQGLALVPKDEIERGRDAEVRNADSRGRRPDANQLLGMRITERFQQDAFHNAKHDSIGADADGEGKESDSREERGTAQAAKYLSQLNKNGHGRSPAESIGCGWARGGWFQLIIRVLQAACHGSAAKTVRFNRRMGSGPSQGCSIPE